MNDFSSNSAGEISNIKQISPAKCWCFTLNNYTTDDILELKNKFSSDTVKGYIFGEEIAPTTGTPHLQGYVEFKNKLRPLSLKLNKKICWSKKYKDSTTADCIKYCSKDGICHWYNFKPLKPLKLLKDEQLYKWQKEIIEIVKKEPDDRTIYWFWEENGCAGKTQFCKYLAKNYNAIPIEGKKNDILYCASLNESELYIMDIERSCESYISYSAIEKIKNGFYMVSKYESRPIIRNSPHVIIFANFEPDINKLSRDRWQIKNIA